MRLRAHGLPGSGDFFHGALPARKNRLKQPEFCSSRKSCLRGIVHKMKKKSQVKIGDRRAAPNRGWTIGSRARPLGVGAPQTRRDLLEKLVVDEAYFFQAAMLQVRQCLRHDLVVGEFVHRNVHLRLRRFRRFRTAYSHGLSSIASTKVVAVSLVDRGSLPSADSMPADLGSLEASHASMRWRGNRA